MFRRLMMAQRSAGSASGIPDNEMWYTTSNGNFLSHLSEPFDVAIESETYENGKGVIRCVAPITKIFTQKFYGNRYLQSITFPNSLISIGDSAFGYTRGPLAEVVIPDSVESIGASAFESSTSLTMITLGAGLKTIGSWAFAYTSIDTVYCRATTPPTLVDNFLVGCPIMNIYVPKGTRAAYTSAAYWSGWASSIREYEI